MSRFDDIQRRRIIEQATLYSIFYIADDLLINPPDSFHSYVATRNTCADYFFGAGVFQERRSFTFSGPAVTQDRLNCYPINHVATGSEYAISVPINVRAVQENRTLYTSWLGHDSRSLKELEIVEKFLLPVETITNKLILFLYISNG